MLLICCFFWPRIGKIDSMHCNGRSDKLRKEKNGTTPNCFVSAFVIFWPGDKTEAFAVYLLKLRLLLSSVYLLEFN